MKVRLLVFLLVLLCQSSIALAADWTECRRAKLESLQLQSALRKGKVLRGYRSRSRSRSAMRDAMRNRDKWLWRECRYYSAELRDLAVK